MVVDPNDLKPVAGENSDSPPKPTVQFLPTTNGLPGGDMYLSRSTTSSSPTYGPSHQVPLALPSSSSSTSMNNSMHIITPPLDENEHHYVGLVNQAMTCYLNSLIQSLYMTPEFRNAIYKWEYKTGKGSSENSIPCQIQKLFLLLQTSENSALETKDLTASFGWNSTEAYDQHDVQELCRLMFDALEVKWKNSPHDKLIQNLYQGSMQDFVKCLKCGKENVRKDFFLDLPLALKPFGAVESYKSIEEALSAFVDPELLSGCNQYHCENCNSKQDAHKGLRVTNFPYLLTIQLKRFDFDYNTMHRIKLNDKMTFPDVLDLNAYVYDPENPQSSQSHPTVDPDTVTVGEQIDPEYVNELLEKNGRFVYELFSVMVHQGSAAGGHYYAYIKNVDQGKWYLFNDSRVESTNPNEIQRSFGGAYGGWSGSNTNAYMLMYRQIDRVKNKPFIRSHELPRHISTLMATWKQDEENKEKQKQYRLSLVKVYVRLNVLSDVEIPVMEMEMEPPRTNSISTIFSEAFSFFSERCNSVKVSISKGNSRLISFDKKIMTAVYVSKNDMDKTIESIMYPSYSSSFDLNFLLDVKIPGRNFFPISCPGRTISIQRVDIVNRVVRPPYLICLSNSSTHVIKLKEMIGEIYGDDSREYVAYRMVMEKGDKTMNKMSFMDVPTQTIDIELRDCYTAIPNMYFDGGNAGDPELQADRTKILTSSLMYQILARKKFAVMLKIQLPTEEEVNRVASACSAFVGPCWSETMSNTESSDVSMAMEVLNDMPRSVESQRPTSPSSEISDDGSMIISTGSICQNTPQTSPNVSDGGDADEGIGSDDIMATCDPNSIMRTHDVYSDVSMSLETDSGSGSTMVPPSSNFDREIIVKEELPHNVYTVDVDSRLTVGELKAWIANKIKTDPAQFVITKYTQEFDAIDSKGYETQNTDEETLSSAFSGANWIAIKLRPPLKENEKLIKIICFDTEDPIKDNWKNLFDIPAAKHVLVGDILLRCQRLYHELYGTKLERNRIRLRDLSMCTKTVLSPNRRLESRSNWSNPIYLQILTDEKVIGMKGEPLLVRRFRPSTVEVGPIHEVMVSPDMSNHIFAIRSAISKYTNIPIERVEITEPAVSSWESAKWPFLKSRLELLDGGVRFVTEHTCKTNVEFLEKIGIRVIYYRDTAEPRKEITEEERKQITIKDNTSSTSATICRRKERPLRIQLSSVSEA